MSKSKKPGRADYKLAESLKTRWDWETDAVWKRAAAFVDGPADRVARLLVLESGALQLTDADRNVEELLNSMNKDGHDCIGQVQKFIEARVSADIMAELSDAVDAAANDQALTAYLLGVAVGRRLGPQRFTGGGR